MGKEIVANTDSVGGLQEEIRALRNEIWEMKALLRSAVIRPRKTYLDNAHRDRIIYVLRVYLQQSFEEIRGILPLIYPEWRFTPKAVSQAFYRFKKRMRKEG